MEQETKYQVTPCAGHYEIRCEGSPVLGMADVKLKEADGLVFKDLSGAEALLPYEDWRLDAKTRAADLAGRLEIEEIAGLMLWSSHQMGAVHSGAAL